MERIIKIVHFHNGIGGGVLSVIRNLLKYKQHDQIENHVIYTINKDFVKYFKLPELKGASSEQVFYYSAKWNFYYTCRQLAKLLPKDNATIIAHDWLELGMVSNLGLQNHVVQFVHGNYDYYYTLARKNEASINEFICVSPVIKENLVKNIPYRVSDIHHCRFSVPEISVGIKRNQILHLFYCVGDLRDYNKQFDMLPKINVLLKELNIPVHWTIVGKGMDKKQVFRKMNTYENISVEGELEQEQVFTLLSTQDVLLLPSLKEGFPVVLIESMKAGLVPLVTQWEAGTAQLVEEEITGYYFKTGDPESYALRIKSLHENRTLLSTVSMNAKIRADELFNPQVNTKLIEEILMQAARKNNRINNKKKIYGSRLDHRMLPNIMVSILRKYFYINKNTRFINFTA